MNRLPNEPAYPEPPDHLGDIVAQHGWNHAIPPELAWFVRFAGARP